jgi:PAS domain S-box-containing protein
MRFRLCELLTRRSGSTLSSAAERRQGAGEHADRRDQQIRSQPERRPCAPSLSAVRVWRFGPTGEGAECRRRRPVHIPPDTPEAAAMTERGRPGIQAGAPDAAVEPARHDSPRTDVPGSSGLFALLYDLAPVGYAILDVDSRILDINPAGAALLGGTRTDWLDRSMLTLVQPDQRQTFVDHLRTACTEPDPSPEAPLVLDLGVPDSAQGLRLVRFFLRHHPSGKNRLCFATMLDVTAELRARSRRREVERLQQAVLDALSAQIAVLDATGRITAVNEAWRRFARDNGGSRELEEGVGLNYFHACCSSLTEESEGIAGRALEGIQAVMNGERKEFTLEYPCHSAQTQRWFLMTVTPLGAGERGAVVAHMDISERVRAEQESRQRREEVAHASRLSSVTVLAASLVHELSQPLACSQPVRRVGGGPGQAGPARPRTAAVRHRRPARAGGPRGRHRRRSAPVHAPGRAEDRALHTGGTHRRGDDVGRSPGAPQAHPDQAGSGRGRPSRCWGTPCRSNRCL